MDRLFAGGTVNAAVSGQRAAPALSVPFAVVGPRQFRCRRPGAVALVPGDRSRIAGFRSVEGRRHRLAGVADRMAEAVRDAGGGESIVLGNGYGGFVALQMAIRHPGIASRLILADCGAAFSEEGRQAFRNMAAASKAKGLAAITDVAMRRLFAPEFQAQHPDFDARSPRGVLAQRSRSGSGSLPGAGRARSAARTR